MNDSESLERRLVLAGLDALRELQGAEVVSRILETATRNPHGPDAAGRSRVPIVDYLRYRDAALDHLGERFTAVAFETGRTLVRSLRHRKVDQIQALIARFSQAANKLPVIGQAAVLAARNNPGVVRAAMQGDQRLVVTIEKCPECRGLRRGLPFCFLNQGIITEFSERYLSVRVKTEETACMALGAPRCQVEVSLRN